MRVLIPSSLYSYTHASWVEAEGSSLAELLDDLDRRYPGIRFRIVDEQDQMRAHMRFFINSEQTFNLRHPLKGTDEVLLVQALSGG